jgi:hypothetical protein
MITRAVVVQQLHVHRRHADAALQELPPPAAAARCRRRCNADAGKEQEKNKIVGQQCDLHVHGYP